MWLNETLNIKYPLIQGGMARVATGAFAAASSNAGAFSEFILSKIFSVLYPPIIKT